MLVMRQLRLSLVLLAALLLVPSSASNTPVDVDRALERAKVHIKQLFQSPEKSGGSCVGCTILFGLLNQRALQTGQSVDAILSQLCSDAKNPIGKLLCGILKFVLELIGLKNVDPSKSPELLCQNLKMCPTPAQCLLFQSWPPASSTPNSLLEEARQTRAAAEALRAVNRVGIPGGNDFWGDFSNLLQFVLTGNLASNINQVFNVHLPMTVDDKDNDTFATTSALRGSSWRGKDCNDNAADVYPGRVSTAHPASVDHNCNGISGSDSQGNSYEDQLCSKSSTMGVAIVGDSASAHFSIPREIMTPEFTFNASTWNGILHLIMNEADWPECSWATAYESQDNCPLTKTGKPVESFYSRFRDRNRCNHRDYINVGVNGGRTGNIAPPDGDIMAFRRDQQNDSPALVIYAPIGNDVCNGHPGFDHMTTPDEFAANVKAALTYLDTQLPTGSHVLFVPMADGLLLWDILHNRTHPIGALYPDLYDYLICMDMAPCYGWMTRNETFRNLTQQWADNLSSIYSDIMKNYTFKHFDMLVAPDNLLDVALQKWVAAGGDPADLIEPIDGFHPSQTANALTVEYLWDWLNTTAPSWLGPVNPNNQQIITLFGDQGGH